MVTQCLPQKIGLQTRHADFSRLQLGSCGCETRAASHEFPLAVAPAARRAVAVEFAAAAIDHLGEVAAEAAAAAIFAVGDDIAAVGTAVPFIAAADLALKLSS